MARCLRRRARFGSQYIPVCRRKVANWLTEHPFRIADCEQPDDIVVVLDGDDWFLRDDALALIAKTYLDHDCWLTYGSWVSNVVSFPGLWPAYPAGTENFRSHRWLATAVRTWKKWLWDRTNQDDFRDESGAYFRVGEDVAAMLPMLEMSGTERAKHIDVALMLYNQANPTGAAKIMGDELRRNVAYLRSKPPCKRISDSALSVGPRLTGR